jgi:hypothetical protein
MCDIIFVSVLCVLIATIKIFNIQDKNSVILDKTRHNTTYFMIREYNNDNTSSDNEYPLSFYSDDWTTNGYEILPLFVIDNIFHDGIVAE